MSLLLLACSATEPVATAPTAPQEPAPAEQQPDIVLLFAREAREDPGEERAAAALLAHLGPGRRFRAAYVQTAHPYTSFGSVMTGLYPSAVPLCSRPQLPPGQEMPWCVELPEAQRTLPEVLGVYGYRSLFIHEHPDLDQLARGFDEVRRIQVPLSASPAAPWDKALALAERWWAEDPGRPRLLVVEASLVHGPFEALLEKVSGEWAPDWNGRVRFYEAHPELRGRIPAEAPWPWVDDEHLDLLRATWRETNDAAGAGIAALLQALPSPRRLAIVTALHGISLGERTGTDTPEQARPGGHMLLTDRTTRVLLWMAGPGVEPGTIDAPVELIDLVPTLARVAGARVPAAATGIDLLHDPSDRRAYAEWGDMLALRDGNWWFSVRFQIHGITSLDPRLTEALEHPGRTGKRVDFHLYDLARDPYQADDLADEDLERVLALRQEMLEIRTGPGAPPDNLLTWTRIRQLREVGALHYW